MPPQAAKRAGLFYSLFFMPLHKHGIVCRFLQCGWYKPMSLASGLGLYSMEQNMAYNVSGVYAVKNGHTAKFAMKNSFFVFKAEGQENILKNL